MSLQSCLRNLFLIGFGFAILVSLTIAGPTTLSPVPALPHAIAASSSGEESSWEYAVSFSDRILLFDEQWKEVGQTGLGFKAISTIIYDEIQDRFYINDMKGEDDGRIFALDRDPLNANSYTTSETLVQSVHENERIRSIAFDPLERSLYWIDATLKRIYKLDLKQPKAEPIIYTQFDLQTPQALAVDVCRRFLYWTTANKNVTSIERDSLAGNKHTVLLQERMQHPMALEVDQYSDKLFWIDDEKGTQASIGSADLHGGNRTVVYDGANRDLRSLVVDEQHLFVIDHASYRVYRSNKTANATLESVHEFDKAPKDILKRPRFIENHRDHSICEKAVEELQYQMKKNEDLMKKVPALNQEAETGSTQKRIVCLHGAVNKKGKCECATGWTGTNCEERLCHNYCLHGNCAITSTGLPMCHCEPGYSGERCDVDRCKGYCLNDGQCQLENDEPVCHCSDAFFGHHCEMINSRPIICRSFCESKQVFPNIEWSLEEECSCGNSTAGPLCSMRNPSIGGSQSFIYIMTAAVLLTIVLIVVLVLGSIRRWYKPARPKIKKTYVVRKNITPMTYRPTPNEQCEITIENCCNMQYCDTPCFDPKILVKDANDKEVTPVSTSKDDKRDLLSNIVLDNNSDLF